MKHFFTAPDRDTVGFFCSFLCAIHCLAVPLALTFTAWGGLRFLDSPVIEPIIIVLSGMLVAVSLIPSFLNHHHKLAPLVLALAGFLAIGAGHISSGLWEPCLTTGGALLVAFAHIRNWRLKES